MIYRHRVFNEFVRVCLSFFEAIGPILLVLIRIWEIVRSLIIIADVDFQKPHDLSKIDTTTCVFLSHQMIDPHTRSYFEKFIQ